MGREMPFAMSGKTVFLVIIGVVIYGLWRQNRLSQLGNPGGENSGYNEYNEYGEEEMDEMRTYYEDRTPEGRLYTRSLTVTDNEIEIKLYLNLQSLLIINDDVANSVFIKINDKLGDRKEIKFGESNSIDFELHRINIIYLSCGTGLTAPIRLEGLY